MPQAVWRVAPAVAAATAHEPQLMPAAAAGGPLLPKEKSIDFSLVALQLLYSLIPIIGAVARQQHSCC